MTPSGPASCQPTESASTPPDSRRSGSASVLSEALNAVPSMTSEFIQKGETHRDPPGASQTGTQRGGRDQPTQGPCHGSFGTARRGRVDRGPHPGRRRRRDRDHGDENTPEDRPGPRPSQGDHASPENQGRRPQVGRGAGPVGPDPERRPDRHGPLAEGGRGHRGAPPASRDWPWSSWSTPTRRSRATS